MSERATNSKLSAGADLRKEGIRLLRQRSEKTDDADADAVVGAKNARIAGSGGGRAAAPATPAPVSFEKIAAGRIFCEHGTSSGLGEAK